MNFRNELRKGSTLEEIENVKMRCQFARLCLDSKDLDNEKVYDALSHLAKLSSLGINLNAYERLRIPPMSSRLSSDDYVEAKQKLKQAEELLITLGGGTL